jgi:hypothetical protein
VLCRIGAVQLSDFDDRVSRHGRGESGTTPGAAHAERTADAERIAHVRALADNARRIADPQLRADVEALATGASTPAEFVRFIDTSPHAWRGLNRTVTAYLALTDHQPATDQTGRGGRGQSRSVCR